MLVGVILNRYLPRLPISIYPPIYQIYSITPSNVARVPLEGKNLSNHIMETKKPYVVVKLTAETNNNSYEWKVVQSDLSFMQADEVAHNGNNAAIFNVPNLYCSVLQSTWQSKGSTAAVLVKARKAYTDKLYWEDQKQIEEEATKFVLGNRFKLNQQVQIVGTQYIFAKNHGGFMQNTGQHCNKQVQAEIVEAEEASNGMLDIKNSNYYGAIQLEIVATKNCADCDFYVCYQPMNLELDLVLYMVMHKVEEDAPVEGEEEDLDRYEERRPYAKEDAPTESQYDNHLPVEGEEEVFDVMAILYPDGAPAEADCNFCDKVLGWTKVDDRLTPLQNRLCATICEFMEEEVAKHAAEAKRLADEATAELMRQEKLKREEAAKAIRIAEIVEATKKMHPLLSDGLLVAIANETYARELEKEAERLKRLSPKEAEVLNRNMKHEKRGRGTVAEPKKYEKKYSKRLSNEKAAITEQALEETTEAAMEFIAVQIKTLGEDAAAIKVQVRKALKDAADRATASYIVPQSKRDAMLDGTTTASIMLTMLQNMESADEYIESFALKGNRNIATMIYNISEHLSCHDLDGAIADNKVEALKRYNEAKAFFLPNVNLPKPEGAAFVYNILTLSRIFVEFNRLCGLLQSEKTCKLEKGGRIIDLFR
jgi:hypothetical protein